MRTSDASCAGRLSEGWTDSAIKRARRLAPRNLLRNSVLGATYWPPQTCQLESENLLHRCPGRPWSGGSLSRRCRMTDPYMALAGEVARDPSALAGLADWFESGKARSAFQFALALGRVD